MIDLSDFILLVKMQCPAYDAAECAMAIPYTDNRTNRTNHQEPATAAHDCPSLQFQVHSYGLSTGNYRYVLDQKA